MKKMRAAISNSSTIEHCCCGFPGCLKCIEFSQQRKPLTNHSSSTSSNSSSSSNINSNADSAGKSYKGLIILLITGISLMCASCMTYILDPQGLAIKIVLTMTDGSFIFRLWQKPPINIQLKVYLFNVTNSEEFLRGEHKKIRFQEVGPYIYSELLENEDVHFNDNGTLTFVPRRRAVPSEQLLRETGLGRGLEDKLIVPNIPLLGIASKLSDYSMFVQMGFSTLVNTVDSKPFENTTVRDYLWGHDDPIVKIANMALSDWITFERLGLLDRMFDTGNDVVTIDTKTFVINRYNGQTMLHEGYTSKKAKSDIAPPKCAEPLEGVTEGVLFARDMSRKPVTVYRKAFCRTMALEYAGDEPPELVGGVPGGLRFTIPGKMFNASQTPEHGCHCGKTNEHSPCRLVPGLSDITPCYYGIPAAASFPHFLHGDPSLFNKVEGLHPNHEKHGSHIVIQQRLGVPLASNLRMQTNLVLRKNKYIKRISKFGDMVLPIIWTELMVNELPSNLDWLLRLCLKVVPPIQNGFIYGAATFGFSCILAAMCGYICKANYSKYHDSDPESPRSNRKEPNVYHLVHVLTPGDLINDKESSGLL